MNGLPLGLPLDSLLVIALVVGALFSDLKWRRLPNWLTLGGAALGLGLALVSGGPSGGAGSAGGWLLGCVLLWLPFMMGGMGAGDVKLLAAVGALKGASFVFMAFVYGALAGGAFALVALVLRGELLPLCKRLLGGIISLSSIFVRYQALPSLGGALAVVAAGGSSVGPVARAGRRASLPYGVAIAAGSLIALALGH